VHVAAGQIFDFSSAEVKSQANTITKAKQTAEGKAAPLKRQEPVLLPWEFKRFLILRNPLSFQKTKIKKSLIDMDLVNTKNPF